MRVSSFGLACRHDVSPLYWPGNSEVKWSQIKTSVTTSQRCTFFKLIFPEFALQEQLPHHVPFWDMLRHHFWNNPKSTYSKLNALFLFPSKLHLSKPPKGNRLTCVWRADSVESQSPALRVWVCFQDTITWIWGHSWWGTSNPIYTLPYQTTQRDQETQAMLGNDG